MGKDVAGELERHRKEFGDRPDGLIFHGARGGILTRGRRSETWARYRDAIGGQKGEGWHQLRPYHASKLINAGMSVVAVAERLGHRDAKETLQTYAHLWPGDEASMEGVAVQIGTLLLTVLGPSETGKLGPGPSLDRENWPLWSPSGIIGNRRVTRID